MTSPRKFDNYIAGNRVEAGSYQPNINPSDISDTIGEFARANADQVNAAIAAAAESAPAWGLTTPQVRSDILRKVGDEILGRKDEIGHILAREEGKTLAEGVGEAVRASQFFHFFSGEAIRLYGEIVPSIRPGISVEISREPVGVIGIITPWNFPIAIPAWKIAPALAFGNTVVFKPAEIAPACGWLLADIISRAGLPDGVFNLVMGKGSDVGNAMIHHPDIGGVSFTGSVDTGALVRDAAATRGAKVQLEMGGKNPLVVLDDADLDIAIDCAVQGAFYSTGQRCTATSRLIVTEGIHDAFVDGVIAATKKLVVGNAIDPKTQIGPVVDAGQLNQDLSYIKIGKQEGAELACGGERLERETDGFYLAPTLFTNTNNQMRINQEEIFGPVTSVIKVADYDEALAVANDTSFGLSAAVCTQSLKYAHDFKRMSQAGMVMVNLPTAGADYHVPFGGRKGSSYGSREQGTYAREFYTIVKTAYTRPA